MKKILCLALVLILTMSVALPASAVSVEDITAAAGNIDFSQITSFLGNIDLSKLASFEMPQYDSLQDAFKDFSDFMKLEGIMKYVNEFHVYMGDFYDDLHVALQAFGVVLNSLMPFIFIG